MEACLCFVFQFLRLKNHLVFLERGKLQDILGRGIEKLELPFGSFQIIQNARAHNLINGPNAQRKWMLYCELLVLDQFIKPPRENIEWGLGEFEVFGVNWKEKSRWVDQDDGANVVLGSR